MMQILWFCNPSEWLEFSFLKIQKVLILQNTYILYFFQSRLKNEHTKLVYGASWNAVLGFWSGWIGGGALIAGGKLWTLMTDPQVKVSTLLGYIGTPAFRRQLAVGTAVACVTIVIFEYICTKSQIERDSLSGKIFTMFAVAATAALGSFAAHAITHSRYILVLYSITTLSVILLSSEFYQRFDTHIHRLNGADI